jgi:hypothetical protein
MIACHSRAHFESSKHAACQEKDDGRGTHFRIETRPDSDTDMDIGNRGVSDAWAPRRNGLGAGIGLARHGSEFSIGTAPGAAHPHASVSTRDVDSVGTWCISAGASVSIWEVLNTQKEPCSQLLALTLIR